MLREEELRAVQGGEKKREGVPAVLLQDLLSLISSNTVILKVDVQGYECRVREGLDRKYPFIFFINNLDCWQGQQDMKIVFFQTLQPSILLGGGGQVYSGNFHRMGHGCSVRDINRKRTFTFGHCTHLLTNCPSIFSKWLISDIMVQGRQGEKRLP